MTLRADLVVVGGGLAGLTAALRGTDLGLKVLLVEAGSGEFYPCNSRYSGGVLHAAYQDITLPADELLRRMESSGTCDPEQARAVADDAQPGFAWLRAKGARIAHFPHLKRGAWVLVPPRPMVTGLLDGAAWRGRGPDLTLRTLRAAAVRGGCLFIERTRAEQLLMKAGRCHGLVARGPQGRVCIESAAVVLADGGFSGNRDLFQKYIGPAPEKVVQRGAGTGLGDALRMGMEAGAATTALDRFYGHLLSRDALNNDRLWPYPQIDALAAAGVLVNRSGHRILDEGLGGVYASNVLATMADPTDATVIVDAAIWKSVARIGMVAPDPLLMKHGGTVFESDDIHSLARQASLDHQALAHTIASYNAAVQSSRPATLHPPRTAAKAAAMPIIHPPFKAIPVCSGITNTMGGLLIDAHARVLDTRGERIPGLYAAGATTGGLEGGPAVAYIGGLMKALVFGRRAAEDAARAFSASPGSSTREVIAC